MNVPLASDDGSRLLPGAGASQNAAQRQTHSHREQHEHSHSHSHSHSESHSHSDSESHTFSYTHSHSHEYGRGQAPTHAHTAHGDAQRQALTQVAFRLIAEGGLERFRTREVAKRAGVNIATLHYYFPSKEDLIRSVVDYLSNEFSTRQAPFTGEPGEALGEIHRELTDSLYQLREFPEIFVVLFELFLRALRDPVIHEMTRGMDVGWHEHIVSYLREGVRRGTLRADLNPDVAGWELIALIKGCVMQIMAHPQDFPIERVHADVERWFTENSSDAKNAPSE